VHESLLLVSACNGRRIGGGLPMAPAARLDDRRLDAVCVASRSRLHTATLLARLARGRHLRDPGVRLVRCRSATFRPRRPIPVALDGEVVARQATLVRLAMAPEPLALLGG
jgi:diacylglycerol kinase family enzyme